jgi:hypothetical protein
MGGGRMSKRAGWNINVQAANKVLDAVEKMQRNNNQISTVE